MKCTLDLKTLREEVQLNRVYAFLASLNDVFDKVRSDILRTQPLPSVEEVFSVIRRKAQHHATMMGGSAVGNQGGTLPMAMVSWPHSSGRPCGPSSSTDSRPFTRENKDDLKCTFCGQTQHTEDICFQKHGVLGWFSELKKKLCAKEHASSGASGMRPPMAVSITGNKDAMPTQGDPSQALLTRLNASESSSNTSTDGCVLLASSTKHHTGWILDSGATDHIMFDKRLFKYMTTTHQKCVATANGTTVVVTGLAQ